MAAALVSLDVMPMVVGSGAKIDVAETADTELSEVSGTETIACRASTNARSRGMMDAWMQVNIGQRWYSAIKKSLCILKV